MTIALTERDNGGRVDAHVGDTIELRLPENAAAGYRWAPDDVEPRLFEVAETGADYPYNRSGSGGMAYFTITVRAPGAAPLRFKYWRHWEGEEGVLKRFAVEVEARPRS